MILEKIVILMRNDWIKKRIKRNGLHMSHFECKNPRQLNSRFPEIDSDSPENGPWNWNLNVGSPIKLDPNIYEWTSSVQKRTGHNHAWKSPVRKHSTANFQRLTLVAHYYCTACSIVETLSVFMYFRRTENRKFRFCSSIHAKIWKINFTNIQILTVDFLASVLQRITGRVEFWACFWSFESHLLALFMLTSCSKRRKIRMQKHIRPQKTVDL